MLHYNSLKKQHPDCEKRWEYLERLKEIIEWYDCKYAYITIGILIAAIFAYDAIFLRGL